MNTNIIKTAGTAITRTVGKVKLGAIKHSPEILIGVGVVSIVVGTVMACKATLKVEEILDEHSEKKAQINQTKDMNRPNYTEDDAKKDSALLLAKTTGKIIRNYAVPAIMIGGGIACFLGAYGIMKGRNAALTAALSATTTAFDEYRARVREDLGDDADQKYMYGVDRKELVREDGEVKEQLVTKDAKPAASAYARYFNKENTTLWRPDNQSNLRNIMVAQNYANQMLRARGYVFVNDVYDFLGMTSTAAGQMMGWIIDGEDTPYITIDTKEIYNYASPDEAADWARHTILIDFHPQGNILGKMEKAAERRNAFFEAQRGKEAIS